MHNTLNLYFTHPAWLVAIPATLVLFSLILWRWLNRFLSWHTPFESYSRQRYRHPLQHLLSQLNSPESATASKRTHWQTWLQYSVLLCLLQLALAQPFRLGAKIPEPPPQREVVFLVDTSVSMLLRDYQVDGQRTDRLSMLKGVLDYFITHLSGNRLAILIFSEETYTLVPMTQDQNLLRHQIQRLEPAVLTGRTTNLSKALLHTDQQFVNNTGEKPALILITDASRPNRDLDPRTVAKRLAEQGFHLHVIAMGAASYQAQEQDRLSLIYHPANFQLLEQIAQQGNGQFFRARNTGDINQALLTIHKTEQKPPDTTEEYIPLPLYHWPIGIALAWIALWQLLPILQRLRR